ELAHVLGRLRQEAVRPAYGAVGRRREVARRPRPFLEIEGVGLARRAGEKDEDAVLRAALQRDVRRDRRRLEQARAQHVRETRRDESRAGDAEEVATREAVAAQRKSAGLITRGAVFAFAGHCSTSVEKELQRVQKNPLQI